jgi:alkylated DNA repair dioxygenase AlkB
MASDHQQGELFAATQPLPHGLIYRPDFLTRDEEADLLEFIAPLPFREARFREYFAKRRVVFFDADAAGVACGSNDGDRFSSGPLPAFLSGLQARAAVLAATEASAFVHALISEYRTGTPIGWHRDQSVYGIVVGFSLAGWGRMRFRPLDERPDPKHIVVLDLAPRSAYVLQGAIRWQWQHSMLPTRELRYSITFRTAAAGA